MAQQEILDAALAWHDAGCAVVPIELGRKSPTGTEGWQLFIQSDRYDAGLTEIVTTRGSRAGRRQDRASILRMFGPGSPDRGLGVPMGSGSGQVEMLEVEGRARTSLRDLQEIAASIGLSELWARLFRGYLEQSPSRGAHLIYRIADWPEDQPLPGSTRLAARPAPTEEEPHRVEVLAETRGQGGQVVVAPTPTRFHNDQSKAEGRDWTLVAGGPDTLPTITVAERELLHKIFATLDEMPERGPRPERPAVAASRPEPGADVPPGSDYSARADWSSDELLGGLGLVESYEEAGTVYWRWADGEVGSKVASTRPDEGDQVYLWTTSTALEAERPLSKFAVYAALHHNGDYGAAALELRALGYGSSSTGSATAGGAVTVGSFLGLADDAVTAAAGVSGAALALQPDELAQRRAAKEARRAKEAAEADEEPVQVRYADDRLGSDLVDGWGDVIRYAADAGRWYWWDGTALVEQPRSGGHVRELVKALLAPREEGSKAGMNALKGARSARGVSAILSSAETDPRVAVTVAELDRVGWELNTPAGICDLRTGSLRPHDVTSMHTRTTRVAPDFAADDSVWTDLLAVWMRGDAELVDYLWRLAGYALIGEVREHVIPFMYGTGGNGKSVFLESLLHVMGPYARTVRGGFLAGGGFEQHSTEIAGLAGARLVVANEVGAAKTLNEDRLKMLSSGEPITARRIARDETTFEPSHLLVMVGNQQPELPGGGDSIWRRLRQVPWLYSVPDHLVDPGLPRRLREQHGPAILAWAVRGAAEYAARGLGAPTVVQEATDEYREQEDSLAAFAEQELVFESGATVEVKVLRLAYEAWCDRNELTALPVRRAAAELKRMGAAVGREAPRVRSGYGRVYGDVRLRTLEEEADAARTAHVGGPDLGGDGAAFGFEG